MTIVSRGAALCVVLLLGACAHTARVTGPHIPAPVVDPLPVSVAVFYTDEVRLRTETASAMGDRLIFPLGDASLAWLDFSIQATFARVVNFNHRPTNSELMGFGLDMLLEIQPGNFHFDLFGSNPELALGFRMVLSTPDGAEISRWSVNGSTVSAIKAEPGHLGGLDAVLGEQATDVLRDAAAHFLLGFRDGASVQSWLRQRDAYVPVLGNSNTEDVGQVWGGHRVLVTGPDPDIVQCMLNGLRKHMPAGDAVTVRQVRDELFPWFEDPRDALSGLWANRAHQLAHNASGAERLRLIGLRDVVRVGGGTEMTGLPLLLGSPAGVFGVWYGTRRSALTATVGRLSDESDRDSELQVKRQGKFAIPAFIVPLPLVPPTQTEACDALASATVDSVQLHGRDRTQGDAIH